MRRRPWGVALLVVGGVAAGLAVAGLPDRDEDPPLRVEASETTTTTVALPVTVAPTTSSSAAPVPTTSSTVRPRR